MSLPAQIPAEGEGIRLSPEATLSLSFVRSVIRFATLRTGSVVFDEDLEQETFLRILQAIRRMRHVQYPKALVVKIVRDTVADHWRRRRWLENTHSIPERFVAYRPSFEESIDHRRRLRLLHQALSNLSPHQRETIELFYLFEHSIDDIARRLCSSPSAIKMTLLRGRQELRQMVRTHLARSRE